MKIEEGRISILFGGEETTIEISDANACVTFVRIKLTPEQVSQAFSRQMHIPIKELEVSGLDKLGKTHQNEQFTFKIPKDTLSWRGREEELNRIAIKALSENNLSDWTPDKQYSSQNSFFTKDGQAYANVTIRRWI